tara:strand:+ start:3526 stop:3903 length:378 start_codon:yes stop_codon:yes gene_type:complete
MANNKWSKKELEEFKNSILDKKEVALKDLSKIKERTDNLIDQGSANSIYSSHMADAGSDHQEMENAYYMMQREDTFIKCLEKALTMIEEGTFGICNTCNERISKARLDEVPHSNKCVECKERSKL